ncbi:MAG TPA: hypothetical protein VHV83_05505, partial [Armatimonadota bacterium]|nr:hypothetical protein [Armatimonadota bacterium]
SVLSNRQGVDLQSRWNPVPKLGLSFAVGSTSDTVGDTTSETKQVGFLHLGVHPNIIKNTSIDFGLDRLLPSGEDSTMLGTVTCETSLTPTVNVNALFAFGETLRYAHDPEFLWGISLPQIDLYGSPRTVVSIGKSLGDARSLRLAYWGYDSGGSRASLAFNTNINSKVKVLNRMALSTELGQNFTTQTPYFEGRLEYSVNSLGDMQVGLLGRMENKKWTVELVSDIAELFSLFNRRIWRVSEKRIDPEVGAIQGIVFVDSNADGRQDPDETGLKGVVVQNEGAGKTITDKRGFFILPATGSTEDSRVYLDMKSIPAIYSPVSALQKVSTRACMLTPVNLYVAQVYALTGSIAQDKDSEKSDPLTGVHVMLYKKGDTKLVSESYTALDGSYYFSDILPGNYTLAIDAETLPEGYVLSELKRDVKVIGVKNLEEIKLPMIKVGITKKQQG